LPEKVLMDYIDFGKAAVYSIKTNDSSNVCCCCTQIPPPSPPPPNYTFSFSFASILSSFDEKTFFFVPPKKYMFSQALYVTK